MPAVYGAQVEYISRLSHGDETLPDWSDFGDKRLRGLLIMVAWLIYYLPVVAISVIFFVPIVIASVGTGNSNVAAVFAAGGTCLFMLVAIIYSIAVSIFFYAAVTNYAMTNDLVHSSNSAASWPECGRDRATSLHGSGPLSPAWRAA